MDVKYITVKEAALNNNCPECFNNQGLNLTFKQKFVENKFYKSLTEETIQEIECRVCNTMIYPVRWTEDIERVFKYHQKAFIPKTKSMKLKKLSWVLIISSIILLALLITAALLWL
ncbi:hypothetical protein LRR18_05915 [Mangrovimonas sp. AS39]|uniref:hypothetical protein n=1 Tax=Mangrovimonas TaxID=1211036 RepID=UPI00142032B4|nr:MULTISPECIES: hypothetical protein [Mangrovimonas]MCF1191115.1 hypothetical protein [Mangrovimonas futianensis]MCF1194810.1 hypothetical protein [Mangrovimonas futianensis]NIK91663.1 hypothetical protein [Mangrovimonas sp. CR14]